MLKVINHLQNESKDPSKLMRHAFNKFSNEHADRI